LNLSRYLALVCLLGVQCTSAQDREIDTGIIEIGLTGGYYWASSSRNLDDAASLGAAMGLHPTKNWAFLLSFQTFKTDDTRANGESDVEIKKYHIDSHYYFRADHRLRPYLVGGLGEIEVKGQRLGPGGGKETDKETLLIGGAGLSYTLTPRWSLRGELSHAYSLDESQGDNTLQFTVAYRFIPRD
jgi:opacity protein-like surface antigen